MSTDRVEINPDNNNKTLEQSQEDLAKQGVNVNEGVVNNNGESVNISQPENTSQSSDQQARPNWLPEKFKSAEELAKAYGELEKKMSAHRKKNLVNLLKKLQSQHRKCNSLISTMMNLLKRMNYQKKVIKN